MWNAKILNSTYGPASLVVRVEYRNGEAVLTEDIDMTGGSIEVLNRKVQSKIDTLETTETLNDLILTGDFVPSVKDSDISTFRESVRKVEELKRLTDLGIIDAPLNEAIQNAKDSLSSEVFKAI